MADETIREHFDTHTVCWRDLGPCAQFHAVHVHVDFNPWGTGDPLCSGGHGPAPSGGWSSPGSPRLQAFVAEVREKFPDLKLEFFNCRKVEGSSSWSQHAFWNAVDIMTPTVPEGQAVWDWINGPYVPPPPPPPPPSDGGDDELTPEQAAILANVDVTMKLEVRHHGIDPTKDNLWRDKLAKIRAAAARKALAVPDGQPTPVPDQEP